MLGANGCSSVVPQMCLLTSATVCISLPRFAFFVRGKFNDSETILILSKRLILPLDLLPSFDVAVALKNFFQE